MTDHFLDLILVADQFTLSRNEGGPDSVLHQLLNNFLSLTNELRTALKENLFFFLGIFPKPIEPHSVHLEMKM